MVVCTFYIARRDLSYHRYMVSHKNVDVFSAFTAGAKQGIQTSTNILPSLIALMTCIAIFQASVLSTSLHMDYILLLNFSTFQTKLYHRPFSDPSSGSGALSVFQNILNEHGPEQLYLTGRQRNAGSSETTFYTIVVYYGAIKISKSRYITAV